MSYWLSLPCGNHPWDFTCHSGILEPCLPTAHTQTHNWGCFPLGRVGWGRGLNCNCSKHIWLWQASKGLRSAAASIDDDVTVQKQTKKKHLAGEWILPWSTEICEKKPDDKQCKWSSIQHFHVFMWRCHYLHETIKTIQLSHYWVNWLYE